LLLFLQKKKILLHASDFTALFVDCLFGKAAGRAGSPVNVDEGSMAGAFPSGFSWIGCAQQPFRQSWEIFNHGRTRRRGL
jgi:hypothetical protein